MLLSIVVNSQEKEEVHGGKFRGRQEELPRPLSPSQRTYLFPLEISRDDAQEVWSTTGLSQIIP